MGNRAGHYQKDDPTFLYRAVYIGTSIKTTDGSLFRWLEGEDPRSVKQRRIDWGSGMVVVSGGTTGEVDGETVFVVVAVENQSSSGERGEGELKEE
ncbi:hypothetical protein Droror1_Dr00011248 [Drosera rotundifolia]